MPYRCRCMVYKSIGLGTQRLLFVQYYNPRKVKYFRPHPVANIDDQLDILLFIDVTQQEENFHWNSNFAKSLMSNLLNFDSAKFQIMKNLLMLAYITKIQKAKFADI